MKKVLSLIAVAIMALAATFCFSSCSKDDSTGIDDSKNYEESYNLKFFTDDADSTEMAKVISTYKSAFGLSQDEEPTVTIAGKDSAETNSQLRAKMDVAFKGLTNVQDFHVDVYAFNNDDSVVYVNKIGTMENLFYSDDVVTTQVFRSQDVDGIYDAYGDCPISEFTVSTFKDSQNPVWYFYNAYSSINLNKNCDGNYIYLVVMRNSPELSNNDVPDNFWDRDSIISDVIIVDNINRVSMPGTLTYNNLTYHAANNTVYYYPTQFTNQNLNDGVKNAHDIRLYYTYDKSLKRQLVIGNTAICYKYKYRFLQSDVEKTMTVQESKNYQGLIDKGYDVEFAKLVNYSNGQLQATGKDANLNLGAGGRYLYLRCAYYKRHLSSYN